MMPVDDQSRVSPVGGGLVKNFGEALERFSDRNSSFLSSFLGPRIGMRPLKQLLQRVGNGLRAGVDVRKIFEQESRSGPVTYRTVYTEMHRRLGQGDTLSDAARDAGDFFPPMVREMIEVGEHTGKLDAVMLRLAEHYEHLLSLRRTFFMGIAWPMIQLVFGVVIVGFLIWVLGVIAESQGGTPIDYLGFGLTGTRGVMIYAAIVLAIAVAIASVILAIRQGFLGALGWKAALKIPLLGKSLETMALARLTWTLSLTQESGMDARHSLRMALRSAQLPIYTDIIPQAEAELMKGKEFHEVLRSQNIFPDEFLQALEAAELSGRLSESMIHLSDDYAQRAANATRVLTGVATFGVYGSVALMLIFIIFRVFSSYVRMLESFL